MYQTILVPLDGSARAEKILTHVEELAQRCKAKVLFLQVIEPNSVTMGLHGSRPEVDMELMKKRVDEVDRYLASWQGEFREKKIQSSRFVEQGPVVETIISLAEREGADLIAMASHGRGGIERVFYGSVAAGVLQRVDRPLLLIRARRL